MAMDGESGCFRPIFEEARARNEAKGIPVEIQYGPAVSAARIEATARQWDVPFPASLRQFYLEMGDGLTFEWACDRSVPMRPFCRLWVLNLAELQERMAYLQTLHVCKADWDLEEAKDPELARHNYQREACFVPFLMANADLVCIDTLEGRDDIVFWDHEWDFYEEGIRGDSGVLLANSLVDFWQGWARVDFVEPKHFWWPGAVVGGGVEWTAAHFDFCA